MIRIKGFLSSRPIEPSLRSERVCVCIKLAFAGALAALVTPVPAAPTSPFESAREEASYAAGVIFGAGLRREKLDLDYDLVARGMRESMVTTNALFDFDKAHERLAQYRVQL